MVLAVISMTGSSARARVLFDNPDQALANRILDQDLKKAIEGLPDEFRMAVLLSDVQNFSYQEIADILSVPIGTVRSRLWRGRRLLQRILWKQAVEAGIVSDPSTTLRTHGERSAAESNP